MSKNTTIQNRSKRARLSSSHTIPSHYVQHANVAKFLMSLLELDHTKEEILFSLGKQLLGTSENPAVKEFLKEFSIETFTFNEVPEGEIDLLGASYQFLNTKLENLEKGSFYTGNDIATDFVSDLDFTDDQTIFDPSCGSGAFLFASNARAEQIFGVDADPIAIMIAKFNYFLKFPNAGKPNIFCSDFFTWFAENDNMRFDYIIGNPPYGANLDLTKIPSQFVFSGESFSYFIEFCYLLLEQTGTFRFLLPESILNVKRHTDIRLFMLRHTNLRTIKKYTAKFTGVMSDVYMIELDKLKSDSLVFVDTETTKIPKKLYLQLKNQIFVKLGKVDIGIIEKVENLQGYDLSSSIFGLGVVTGDNKTKLFSEKLEGMEHIYTGKEVEKFSLLEPKYYIYFDRSTLQQVAPDTIYRAPEKLVYKTISKYLKVALDKSGSLTSNSANIVIPTIPDLDIYTILGLLNSSLFSYLNVKLFGGVNKIAKENLSALPLPRLTVTQKDHLSQLTRNILTGGSEQELEDFINFEIYSLTPLEVEHISKTLSEG